MLVTGFFFWTVYISSSHLFKEKTSYGVKGEDTSEQNTIRTKKIGLSSDATSSFQLQEEKTFTKRDSIDLI